MTKRKNESDLLRDWSRSKLKYSNEAVSLWRSRVLAGESARSIARREGIDPRYMCHILVTRPGGADYMRTRSQRCKGDAS